MLIDTILRSPVASGKGDAVALSSSGYEMAILNHDGTMSLQNIRALADGPKKLGEIDGGSEVSQDLPPPAVGFVNGLKYPMVYKNGTIYWWEDKEDPKSSSPHNLGVPSVTQKPSAGVGWRSMAFSGGAPRLVENSRGATGFWRFDHTPGKFTQQENRIPKSYQPPFAPVYSNNSDAMAFIREREIILTSRDNQSDEKSFAVPTVPDVAPTPSSAPPQNFVYSLAFANGDKAIILRENEEAFFVIDTKPGSSQVTHYVHIPDILQDPPVRPGMALLRPPVAAVLLNESWRFAWLGKNGILLMQEENGNLPWAFNTDTLLSATQLDAITQLAFSDDGDFLISLSQRNWRDQVSYRIWDLSPKRRASLNEMTDNQLQHYACQIAQLEQLPEFQEALNGLRPCVSGDLRAPARANPESDGKAP